MIKAPIFRCLLLFLRKYHYCDTIRLYLCEWWRLKFIAKYDDNEKSYTKSEKDNQNQKYAFSHNSRNYQCVLNDNIS